MLEIEKIKEIEKINKYKKKLLDIKYESLPFNRFPLSKIFNDSKSKITKII